MNACTRISTPRVLKTGSLTATVPTVPPAALARRPQERCRADISLVIYAETLLTMHKPKRGTCLLSTKGLVQRCCNRSEATAGGRLMASVHNCKGSPLQQEAGSRHEALGKEKQLCCVST